MGDYFHLSGQQARLIRACYPPLLYHGNSERELQRGVYSDSFTKLFTVRSLLLQAPNSLSFFRGLAVEKATMVYWAFLEAAHSCFHAFCLILMSNAFLIPKKMGD